MDQPSLTELCRELGSSKSGLTPDQAQSCLTSFGPNVIVGAKKTPLIVKLLLQFTDVMVLILIFAAVISGLAGEMTDMYVIIGIVVINALIGFTQEYRAERALEALKKMMALQARVLRAGIERKIPASQVVPGDILVLAEGDRISADGRIMESNELKTNEAALTGESTPVDKIISSANKNIVFMGTDVLHGSGLVLVTATGSMTKFGKIAKLTSETKQDKSPLQKELFRIGGFVAKFTFGISIILVATGYIQTGLFLKSLLFAAAVAVAAVPEGLPATITIALALGVQRLAKKNAIMRQLSSVETLGSTTTICSDKTGTLTKNEMTLKKIFLAGGNEFSLGGIGYKPVGDLIQKKKKVSLNKMPASLRIFMTIGAMCNEASLLVEKNKSQQLMYKILGDPTEGALLVGARKVGMAREILREKYQKIHTCSFDSVRKMMSVVYENKDEVSVFTKGAAEIVLASCSHVLLGDKKVVLTDAMRRKLLEKNNNYSSQALRTLALAYRPLKKTNLSKNCHLLEKELIFVGFAGIIDPPRSEVKQAIVLTKEAGIRVIIVTGDFGLTASAIADQVGLAKNNQVLISGAELSQLNDADLTRKLMNRSAHFIFARVTPKDKLRIVNILKDQKEIVAVTGDGVNDAPALKRADIGVAMGITGTDVSKEASNMVLADDSFATIITAIKEGRVIYNNLKKFVFYIFSCNIGELITVFSAILFGFPAPFSAVLILCVDLGTDVLPALALGVDVADASIMRQKPRDQKEPIMSRAFIYRFAILGFFIGIIVVGLYLYVLLSHGWQFGQELTSDDPLHIKASTMAFACLILIQMVNAYNSRSDLVSVFQLGLFNNLYLLGSVLVSLFLVIAMLQVDVLTRLLHTTALSLDEWTLVLGLSFLILPIEELRKLVVRRGARAK